MTNSPAQGQKVIRRSTPVLLFPTFVWLAELEDEIRERIHRGATEWLDGMTDSLRELAPGNSWQSEHTLHQLGQFANLVSVIQRMSVAVLEFLRIGHDGIEITGCWANVIAPGAQHAVHHHPNNFLSGVYYLRVEAGSGPRQGARGSQARC